MEKIKKQIRLQPTPEEIQASNKLNEQVALKEEELNKLKLELERIWTEYLECQQMVDNADKELIWAKEKYLKIHRQNQKHMEKEEFNYVNQLPQVQMKGAGFVLRSNATNQTWQNAKNGPEILTKK